MSNDAEQPLFKKGNRGGPHEVASSIGAGGMGEVFRARDTRLNHDGVADGRRNLHYFLKRRYACG